MISKKILRRKQAGGFPGETHFEPRPGWPVSTLARGPLQLATVRHLHAESARLGEINTLLKCCWTVENRAKHRLIPFQIDLLDNKPPVLVDVCGDKSAEAVHVQRAHAQIRARLTGLGCSALWVWRQAMICSAAAPANFKMMFSAYEAVGDAERAAVQAALVQVTSSRTLLEVEEACNLGPRARSVVLSLLLAGEIRLQNPDAKIDFASLVIS